MDMNHESLLRGILKREVRAIARAISHAEQRRSEAVSILRSLYSHSGHARVLGITGAPGSGKSTLVDRLIAAYRQRRKTVAVLAIDPTSPFTGGAILGDRIRMQSHALDEGTYIRSMATRGHLGGLARATGDAVAILDAAGFDVILIETVGVGQDEVDIARTADVTLVVLVPGMGDDIQTMKAGLMEIGDLFVINKADRDGVLRVEQELHALLSLTERHDGWNPLVVKTVATANTGVDDLIDAVQRFYDYWDTSPHRPRQQADKMALRLRDLLQERLLQRVLYSVLESGEFEGLVARVAARELDPYTAVDSVLQRLPWPRIGDEMGSV